MRISRIRSNPQLSPEDKDGRVVAIIRLAEKDRKSLTFIASNKTSYHYDGEQYLRIIKDGPRANKQILVYLEDEYGLLPTYRATSAVVEALDNDAQRGHCRTTRRFAWYDTINCVLYMSQYNGKVWKLDGQEISEIPNGKEVFFLDDFEGLPTPVEIGP